MEKQLIENSRCGAGRHLTLPERAEHLARWKQSGLSARAYALEHAINYKSLYAWRSQSRMDESSAPSSPNATAFVPLRVSTIKQSNRKDLLEVTLRMRSFECVISATANTAELVSLVKSLKQEVFDV